MRYFGLLFWKIHIFYIRSLYTMSRSWLPDKVDRVSYFWLQFHVFVGRLWMYKGWGLVKLDFYYSSENCDAFIVKDLNSEKEVSNRIPDKKIHEISPKALCLIKLTLVSVSTTKAQQNSIEIKFKSTWWNRRLDFDQFLFKDLSIQWPRSKSTLEIWNWLYTKVFQGKRRTKNSAVSQFWIFYIKHTTYRVRQRSV